MKQVLLAFATLLTITSYAQRIKSATFQQWKDTSWENSSIVWRTYDASGFLSGTKNDRWDNGSTNWNDFRQSTYTNDNNGNALSILTEEWDATTQIWKNAQLSTSTYTTDNKRRSNILQFYENGVWENFFKDTMEFDLNGYLITSTRYNWDSAGAKWDLLYRQSYTNNANGIYTEYIEENWNSISMSWDTNRRNTRIIQPDSSVSQSTFYKWDNGSWVAETQQLLTYDSDGYLIHRLYQFWNTFGSVWVDLSQDSLYNFSDGRLDIQITQQWDNLNSKWEYSQKIIMAYEDPSGIGHSSPPFALSLYPNPNRGELFYKTALNGTVSITVYDQTGRLMHQEQAYPNGVISTRLWPQGVYFVRFDSEQGQAYKQVIVAH
jgi:hypothetical protein